MKETEASEKKKMYQNQIIKKRQYRENAPTEIQRQRMKAGRKGGERKNSTGRKIGREREGRPETDKLGGTQRSGKGPRGPRVAARATAAPRGPRRC